MHLDLISRITSPNNWLILPVFILSVLLILLKSRKKNNLFLLKTFVSYHYFKQKSKEDYGQLINISKFIIATILLSVLIAVLTHKQVSYSALFTIFLILGLSFSSYYLITYLLGSLFEQRNLFKDNFAYFKHFLISVSIVSIPLIFHLIIYNTNEFGLVFKFYVFVILMLYILRLYTIYQLGRQQRFLLVHLILYLCTLEILPVFIFYVMFQGR